MSLAAEKIRNLLNAIEISQQHLFEETDYDLLKNAIGGKELFKMIRQKGLTNHLGDFVETNFGPNGYPSINRFSIGVGDKGCAFIEKKFSTYGTDTSAFVWRRNLKGDIDYVPTTNVFTVKEMIGPNARFFTTAGSRGKSTDYRLKSRETRRSQDYSKSENLKYNFHHIIFYKLIPILVPILKKSLLDSRDTLKDAFARGDYATAESLSKQLHNINTAIVSLGPTERIVLGRVTPSQSYIQQLVFDAIEKTFQRIDGTDGSRPGYADRRIEWGVNIAKGDKHGLGQIIQTIKQKLHVR